MERIRKRNEELEKKYREAEEDRLMALKENAMVEIKPPKDEDWPREHKYDKLDFTYDQVELPADDESSPKLDTTLEDGVGLKSQDPLRKSKREFKKFSEGDGPPPDPAYNFLADAERDGKTTDSAGDRKSFEGDRKPNENNKKDWKFNNSTNRGGGGRGGRGRGNKTSPRSGTNGYSNEGDSWKFGDKSDRGGSQKNHDGRQEGNWRRDDGRDGYRGGGDRQNNTDKHRNNRSPTNVARPLNRKDSTGGGDSRGNNIMVSVSQNENGEVKSVKCNYQYLILGHFFGFFLFILSFSISSNFGANYWDRPSGSAPSGEATISNSEGATESSIGKRSSSIIQSTTKPEPE